LRRCRSQCFMIWCFFTRFERAASNSWKAGNLDAARHDVDVLAVACNLHQIPTDTPTSWSTTTAERVSQVSSCFLEVRFVSRFSGSRRCVSSRGDFIRGSRCSLIHFFSVHRANVKRSAYHPPRSCRLNKRRHKGTVVLAQAGERGRPRHRTLSTESLPRCTRPHCRVSDDETSH
jgi:hypothetical protein